MSNSDADELRLALVLNGGVSLAIWISGVVAEIDALRRCDGEPDPTATAGDGDSSLGVYRALAAALGVRVRVDVIAGTSAGGLNGGVLAAAVATGVPYSKVRQLWMDLGDLKGLLQTSKRPRSLLLGEEMLYAQLRDRLIPIFADAAPTADDPEESGRRVRVILTGTDIAGVCRDTQDSFGGTLKISDHRLHARFAHGGDAGGPDAPGGWAGMLPAEPERRTEMAEAVARAARTSASFPIAFEASKLVLSGDEPGSRSALGDALVTRGGHNVADVMRSENRETPLRRWAMDGGVLDNSPISAVLETMTGLSAERPVQRAVVFVVPYTDDPANAPEPEPGLSRVLDTVLNMPRDVGFTDHLEEVERDLARRAGDRTSYDELLGLPLDVLQLLAESVYQSFWRLRAVTSVWSLLQAYRARLSDPPQSGVALPGKLLAGELAELAHTANVKWLPARDERAADLWSGLVRADSGWRWGGAPPERIALRIADWLMGAREALPENESELRAALSRCQSTLHGAIRAFRAGEQQRRADEAAAVAVAGSVTKEKLVTISSSTWTSARQGAARALLQAVAAALVEAQSLPDMPAEARGYLRIQGVDQHTSQDDVARRLLMADVAWRALRGELEDEHEASNRYEFLRLNAAAPPPFQSRENGDPQKKLFGLQLGHFAGFVRSSWRANDFLWGRLDGAARLVDLLIAPARLRRSPLRYDTIAAIPGLRPPLPRRRGEFLNPLDHDELEEWRSCIQDTLSLGILEAELDGLAAAMESDTDERAFAAEDDLAATLSPGDVRDRFTAYERALGESHRTIRQRVGEERGSDGGAQLAVQTLDVGVSFVEAEGGPLSIAGRLLDAPVHVVGGIVDIRAGAHRIWRVIREHIPVKTSA